MKWRAADATELELPAASFDVVFSNWLLMYLSDDEVSKLASDALRWVRPLDLAHPIRCLRELTLYPVSHVAIEREVPGRC